MASAVIHDDLELFLVYWFRARIAARPEAYCQNVTVDRVEPATGSFPKRLVVIRFDGSARESIVSDSAAVGITILAGTKRAPKDAADLARMVRALAELLPANEPATQTVPRNPVAALNGATGPVAVPEEQDRARQYITLDLVVAGQPFE